MLSLSISSTLSLSLPLSLSFLSLSLSLRSCTEPSTLLCSTLLYSTLLYSTLLYSTLLYSTLLYPALLCSTLPYPTLPCPALLCSASPAYLPLLPPPLTSPSYLPQHTTHHRLGPEPLLHCDWRVIAASNSYASYFYTHDTSYLGFLELSGHRGVTASNFEYNDIKSCTRNNNSGIISLGIILAVSKANPLYNKSLIIVGMPEDDSHNNLLYWIREHARETNLDWDLTYEDLPGLKPKGVKVYQDNGNFAARLGSLSLKCGYKRRFGPHSARAGHTMETILQEMSKPDDQRMDLNGLIAMLAMKQGWESEQEKKAMRAYFKPAITIALDSARLMGLGVQKYINEALESGDWERAELLRREHGELVCTLNLYSHSLRSISTLLSLSALNLYALYDQSLTPFSLSSLPHSINLGAGLTVKTFHNNPRLLHRLEGDPGYFECPHHNARTYFDHIWGLYVQSPLSFYFEVLQEVHPEARGQDKIELQVGEAAIPISIPRKSKLRLYVTQLLHKREVTRQTLATLGPQWHKRLKELLGNHLGTFPTPTQVYVRQRWCASPYGWR